MVLLYTGNVRPAGRPRRAENGGGNMSLFFFFDPAELEYGLRILLAAVCGGVIGFERERRFKSAGIRTHVIVALSAALMTVLSKYGFSDVVGNGVAVDASRMAASVVSAIGFLGAGVIFFRKDAVSGVTTAAGLWATVGVGIAIGAGRYFTGGTATLLLVLLQVFLHHKTPLVKPQKVGTVVLHLTEPQMEAAVCTRLAGMAERIESIQFRRPEEGRVEISCEVIFPADYDADNLIRALKEIPELYSVEMHWP